MIPLRNRGKAITRWRRHGDPSLSCPHLGRLWSPWWQKVYQITAPAKTTCQISHTVAVSKYEAIRLTIAHRFAVAAVMASLALGAYALLVNGVAYDKSFSSILRTTRNADLATLCSLNDIGTLPVLRSLKGQRRSG